MTYYLQTKQIKQIAQSKKKKKNGEFFTHYLLETEGEGYRLQDILTETDAFLLEYLLKHQYKYPSAEVALQARDERRAEALNLTIEEYREQKMDSFKVFEKLKRLCLQPLDTTKNVQDETGIHDYWFASVITAPIIPDIVTNRTSLELNHAATDKIYYLLHLGKKESDLEMQEMDITDYLFFVAINSELLSNAFMNYGILLNEAGIHLTLEDGQQLFYDKLLKHADLYYIQQLKKGGDEEDV